MMELLWWRPPTRSKRMTTASEDRYLALTARRNRKATARHLSSELAAATELLHHSKQYTEGLTKKALCQKAKGTRNDPSNIVERDRFGSGGVMVWGNNDRWTYASTRVQKRICDRPDISG
ncbi:transposable element Tc1 transposase [Trichonephila clavipes]|nr:transposable element Tc1 transposase [Trichonephila clavipes]